MKKLILSAFGFAAIMGTANAQLLSESFDTAIPATWTIIDVDGFPSTSGQSAYASFAWGAGEALSSSWYDNNGTGPTDDWLITSAIVVPGAGTYTLEYDAYSHESAYLEEYEVLYSTTTPTVAAFTAPALLNVVNEPLGSAAAPNAHAITLPAATAGQTIYIAFHHTSSDESMLHIDNVVVRELLADDAEMTSLNVTPYVTAGNVTIAGVITNQGANTITAMDVVWNDGSGAQTDNLTGLSIATGASYNFTHAIALTAVTGTSYAVNVNVALTGDLNATNDALTTNIAVLTSIPAKVVVGEEKTGSWCQWCPRGAVGLANMEAQSDFIGIAVHNGDPMTVSAYDGAIGTYVPGGYPGGGVDRVIETDPNATALLAAHNSRKTAIVPCAVNSVTALYNSVTGMVSVSTVAEFFGNITGNFRLSCIIVQDDLNSTTAGWPQVNAYSGGGSGVMAFPAGINNAYDFSTGASPAATADFGGYDHVARSLSSNDILGDVGSLPATTVTAGTHNHSFADVDVSTIPGVSAAAFDRAKAHAVVMIINAATGEILNAAKATIDIPVSVENVNVAKFNLKAFPNPTNEVSTISFNLAESATVSMEVFNNVGSVVYAENAKTMNAGTQKITFDGTNLSGGIYFVNLKVGEQIITKKISLIK